MEYKKFIDTLKEIDKRVDEETYNRIMSNEHKRNEYRNKIERLAEEYYLEIPNKEIRAYYDIIEICLENIRRNDKNISLGEGNCLEINVKKKK